MPRSPQPSDWDRLFDPRRAGRRGPLGLALFFGLATIMVAVLLVAGRLSTQEVGERTASIQATQTVVWGTAAAQATGTSAAMTAVAQPTITPTPTVAPEATVALGGNFRSAPEISPQTVLGQVVPGDRVALLENRTAGADVWYRVRVTQSAGTVAPGTEGWIAGSLLTLPATPTP